MEDKLMDPLTFYTYALAIAAVALPAILVLTILPSRRGLAIWIWLLAPPATYIAVIVYETVASAGSAFSISNALLGFSLITAIALLPWLILSGIGVFIGTLLKWIIVRMR